VLRLEKICPTSIRMNTGVDRLKVDITPEQYKLALAEGASPDETNVRVAPRAERRLQVGTPSASAKPEQLILGAA
jgi:hypothetical protein